MIEIETTKQFEDWLYSIKSIKDQSIILSRINRIKHGNLGDIKIIGDGVTEIRFHYSSGYRIYAAQELNIIKILLVGGNKHSQKNDIKKAKFLAKLWRNGELEHE